MKRLPLPVHTVRDATRLCSQTIKDDDLRARIEAATAALEDAETDYRARGAAWTLFGIAQSTVVGRMGIGEMSKLYTQKLSRKREPARAIYDAIMKSAKPGKCPLCAQRQVSTLDHYLAKSRFATLAITPANLVPACADCNKAKLDDVAATMDEQTLHPYFDDIDNEVWLHACLHSMPSLTVEFFPRTPSTWSDTIRNRVTKHFTTFGLRSLYASEAAQELVDIKHRLVGLMASGGEVAVRDHLQEESNSRSDAARNSWRAALYRALSESQWFHQTGHAVIGT